MRIFSKKNVVLFACTVFFLICSFFINYIGTKATGGFVTIGSFKISPISVQGILSALQSFACILMVFTSYRNGIFIALAASGMSIVTSLMPIVRYHSLSSLPGIVSTLISLFSLLIIYSFYKKAAENSLTDYITGLRNRRSYVREMNERLSVNRPFCLACIEVDAFKQINNEFGIQIGDYILKQVALKLSSLLEKNDRIYTITGATFAIIFDNVDNSDIAANRLEKIINSKPVQIPLPSYSTERNCTVVLAAGLTHIGSIALTTKNASAILKDAETALLATRHLPDKKICIFDETMENAEVKQKEAEYLIHQSLQNDYFYLVYQPQFTTNNKELRGFETLIRCKKPDGSIVSPGYFIPAAEKSGLIMQIDDYVLRRAMTEFKPILDSMKKNCILSINVSAKNIGSENFANKVINLLKETKFPAESLEIEITEYSFAESMETTIANIRILRNIGIQIALDDFGTGYTSIAQLMKLPINLLKIDKSLIDEIENSQMMRDMVDSVIYMGHIMNCEVISEGVENENQLELLKKHNCDFIQGFVWGKPQSFSDAERLCLGS